MNFTTRRLRQRLERHQALSLLNNGFSIYFILQIHSLKLDYANRYHTTIVCVFANLATPNLLLVLISTEDLWSAGKIPVRTFNQDYLMHLALSMYHESGYRRCFENIFKGNWKQHDAYDVSPRIEAKTDLYNAGLGGCSVFRPWQGL